MHAPAPMFRTRPRPPTRLPLPLSRLLQPLPPVAPLLLLLLLLLLLRIWLATCRRSIRAGAGLGLHTLHSPARPAAVHTRHIQQAAAAWLQSGRTKGRPLTRRRRSSAQQTRQHGLEGGVVGDVSR
jgi:hypothetical protein